MGFCGFMWDIDPRSSGWHRRRHTQYVWGKYNMMTSSNGNIFRVTSPCWELAGHRWIPLTKASDVGHWCFLSFCAWTNGSVNNRDAGDLIRHRAHYDVTVIKVRLTKPQVKKYHLCTILRAYTCHPELLFSSTLLLMVKSKRVTTRIKSRCAPKTTLARR